MGNERFILKNHTVSTVDHVECVRTNLGGFLITNRHHTIQIALQNSEAGKAILKRCGVSHEYQRPAFCAPSHENELIKSRKRAKPDGSTMSARERVLAGSDVTDCPSRAPTNQSTAFCARFAWAFARALDRPAVTLVFVQAAQVFCRGRENHGVHQRASFGEQAQVEADERASADAEVASEKSVVTIKSVVFSGGRSFRTDSMIQKLADMLKTPKNRTRTDNIKRCWR